MSFRLSPARMDQLERAARDGKRVALMRRGTEYVVVARRLETTGRGDRLVGILPMTGDEISFDLTQVEDFHVIA
ncbi:MAG: hypothetical protein FJ206_11775 [Gemmatimonadetes bacterium]|nr:hypothetical protein [Gemmatimonadota bacterium]